MGEVGGDSPLETREGEQLGIFVLEGKLLVQGEEIVHGWIGDEASSCGDDLVGDSWTCICPMGDNALFPNFSNILIDAMDDPRDESDCAHKLIHKWEVVS